MKILTESTTEIIRINAQFLSYKVSPSIEILYDTFHQKFTYVKILTNAYRIIDQRYMDGPEWSLEDELFDLHTWTQETVLYMELKVS